MAFMGNLFRVVGVVSEHRSSAFISFYSLIVSVRPVSYSSPSDALHL